MDTEMEELEPEELSPEEILSEIRRMLMADMAGQPLPEVPTEEVQEKVKSTVSDYILLTPDMRCDHLFATSSEKEIAHTKARQLLHKLSHVNVEEGTKNQHSEVSTEAIVTDWLKTHLPDMLNEIVSREINKALNK